MSDRELLSLVALDLDAAMKEGADVMSYYGFRPYVPVAKRRRKRSAGNGKAEERRAAPISPVVIEGRKIARSFWGKAWCENLERYSDFENRLPRGRTYVRNGSVVDLQIERGQVRAMVSGSEHLYGEDRYRHDSAGALESDLQGLPWLRRLAGGIASGKAFEKRDGARVPRGGRPVSEPP